MGIRPTEGVIVRNHFHHRNWGLEERYGHCKVRNNETFEIVILAEFQHYKLAVNGHHLGVFRHRLPLALVQFISVSGDVTVDHILLEQDSRSAQESMIFSQVIATPAMPNMPIPMQVHHRHQPPSYFSTPPHSVRQLHNHTVKRMIFCNFQTFTRIGGITIERRHRHRPANVIVVQQHQNSSNVYRF